MANAEIEAAQSLGQLWKNSISVFINYPPPNDLKFWMNERGVGFYLNEDEARELCEKLRAWLEREIEYGKEGS